MNQDAWTDAMQTAMDNLLTATGHTEGKEAYKYMVPSGVANAWALSIGGGPDERDMFCSGIESLRMNGLLSGRFWKMEDAQTCGMLWLAALPIRNDGRLSMLRCTAPPDIKVDGFQAVNTDGVFVCYFVTMPLECIIDVSEG